MMRPLIDIVGVSKHYAVKSDGHVGVLHAVDNVSLRIHVGESVGLVGESGCGKSTLARLLARLIDPSDGAIVYREHDIGALPAKEFARRPERARIQMVFQDSTDSLNPRYSAYDTIAEPIKLLTAMPSSARRARVHTLAEQVGLPLELLARFPHQLSGGQKARVGIARALACDPELLILDEPTSALDVSVQAIILQLLDQLRRERGLAYLFVSHDLNVVRLLCERVLVMYLGKVVESGPVEQVFRAPHHPYTQALVSAIPGRGRASDNFNIRDNTPLSRLRERGRGEGVMNLGNLNSEGADTGAPPGGRIRLSGEVRSPIDPSPTVCRFYGRCPQGVARCGSEMPVLRTLAGERAAACHFA